MSRRDESWVSVLSDHGEMTVIGSGPSAEGNLWTLATAGDDQDPLWLLEVRTPSSHRSRGGYGGPPVSPGMRLSTYTGHEDVGPDQIILRVRDDVAAVTVTLSDGPTGRPADSALTSFSAPEARPRPGGWFPGRHSARSRRFAA